MTLAEFLLARIGEDEADWVRLRDGVRERIGNRVIFPESPGESVTITPAKMLAECEAKRRIVKRHTKCGTGSGYCDDGGHGWVDAAEPGCADLADLALPYADHPGFRDEWRP